MHDARAATMQGKWLRLRNQRGPRKPVTMLAAKGKPGMSQRYPAGSNMADLLGMRRLDAGWGELGQSRLGGRRRQRLLVQGRLLARLAQILPDADIQRTTRAVEHENQRQSDGGFAGRHRQHEQNECLPLEV